MSDKYVNPLSAAKLIALIKSAVSGKLDKTGGTLTGDLTISGAWLNVESTDTGDGNISVDGSLVAGRGVSVLNGDKSVSLVCTGDNAAKIAGLGSNYARLAVGTPTGDNDAATKAYVDERLADAAYYDVYVQLADTQLEDAAVESGCYVIDCTASHTYAEIKAAADAGQTPRVIIVDDVTNPGTDGVICPLLSMSETVYSFEAPNNVGVGGTGRVIIGHITTDYAWYACSAGELPAVKSADNGKYLGVSGGAYQLMTPPASGGSITVDAELSDASENPVQNKAVKAAIDAAVAVRASTSAYGTTKLSNSVTSSSKTLAATPYAVKTALAQAKAYVDSAIAVAINSAY